MSSTASLSNELVCHAVRYSGPRGGDESVSGQRASSSLKDPSVSVCTGTGGADLTPDSSTDVPPPQAKDGEVLVDVHAAALNFFEWVSPAIRIRSLILSSLLMAQGKYQERPPLPFVLGVEFAGRIARNSPIPRGCRFRAGGESSYEQVRSCSAEVVQIGSLARRQEHTRSRWLRHSDPCCLCPRISLSSKQQECQCTMIDGRYVTMLTDIGHGRPAMRG